MSDYLSIDEIQARFAPDWVLIGDPEIDDHQHLHGGRVLFRSPDREEIYRKAIELELDRIAVRYLGPWPEDMAFLL